MALPDESTIEILHPQLEAICPSVSASSAFCVMATSLMGPPDDKVIPAGSGAGRRVDLPM